MVQVGGTLVPSRVASLLKERRGENKKNGRGSILIIYLYICLIHSPMTWLVGSKNPKCPHR